jgi:transposase-like protein
MGTKVFNPEEKAKLMNLVKEGSQVYQEMDDLKSSLKDTIDHIAEEMEIKPSLLTKAIKIAYKESFQQERDSFEDLENILITVGKDK